MDPYLQEAESRRYNCVGVLRLRDGTYAFLAPGYRVVESGVSAARLIELSIRFVMNGWFIYHSEGVSGPYQFYSQALRASKGFK
jgi:hypothetical protein